MVSKIMFGALETVKNGQAPSTEINTTGEEPGK